MSRVVVVTGGAKGIGRATVATFAAHGDRVVALGRDAEALGALGESLGVAGRTVETRTCDVTDEEQVAETFAGIGAVDVLVNNAGVAESAPLTRTTLESLDPAPRGQRHRRLPLHPRGARRHARARQRARSSPSPRRRAASARPTRPPTRRPSTPPSGSCARPPPRSRARGVRVNAVCPTFVAHRDDAALGGQHRRARRAATRPTSEAALGVRIAARPAARPAARWPPACSGSRRPRRRRSTGRRIVLDGGGIQA